MADPAELIDTARYPLVDLESAAARRLIADSKDALAADAICVLPSFLSPAALASLVTEAEALIPRGYYYDRPRVSYEYEHDWPSEADHPATVRHENRYRQVMNFDIANDGPLRRLFLWPLLTDFIRQVLGHQQLYTSACPHLALTLHAAFEGDCNGWHFDPNDGVVTLLLQEADQGGHFEYAANLRSDADPNYAGAAEIFARPEGRVQRPAMPAGSLVLFNGRFSLHHVTKIGPTTKPRLIAIFSYDQRPDMVFSQRYIDEVRSYPQDGGARIAGPA